MLSRKMLRTALQQSLRLFYRDIWEHGTRPSLSPRRLSVWVKRDLRPSHDQLPAQLLLSSRMLQFVSVSYTNIKSILMWLADELIPNKDRWGQTERLRRVQHAIPTSTTLSHVRVK
jgi:hypothetical protein